MQATCCKVSTWRPRITWNNKVVTGWKGRSIITISAAQTPLYNSAVAHTGNILTTSLGSSQGKKSSKEKAWFQHVICFPEAFIRGMVWKNSVSIEFLVWDSGKPISLSQTVYAKKKIKKPERTKVLKALQKLRDKVNMNYTKNEFWKRLSKELRPKGCGHPQTASA